MVPETSRMTLAGLISRWTMPSAWAKCRPEHTSSRIASRSASDSGARRRINCSSVSPGTYSMAMNGRLVVLADIEDRHDVGMAKAPGGARLAREPLARRLVVESLLEQLDGDRAIDRGIAGEVEGAHAAVGNQPDDAIPSDRDGGRRGGMGIGHRVTAQVSGEDSST